MKNSNKQKGFTVIEFLIVAAIIGILAALIIPICQGNKSDAVRKAYRLNDGKLVHCAGISYMNCGVWLYNCEDGIQYNCATNVQELSK